MSEKTTENNAAAARRKPRNAFAAVFLGFLVPGLGHVYAGDVRRGVLFFILITGAVALGIQISGGEAVDVALHKISFIGQAGAGAPTVAVAAYKYLRAKRKLAESRLGKTAYDDIVAERRELYREEYAKRGHINPWAELGILLATIAGLLNVLVFLDAGDTASSPPAPAGVKKDEADKAAEDAAAAQPAQRAEEKA